MSRFWKLFGSIAGMIAGLLMAAAVAIGLGSCTNVSVINSCTVLGLTVDQITTALTVIGGAIGTWLAPANTP